MKRQIKAQLTAAERLIEDENYQEALDLLSTIQHREARQMEKRVKGMMRSQQKQATPQKAKPKRGCLKWVIIFALGYLGLMIFGSVAGSLSFLPKTSDITATAIIENQHINQTRVAVGATQTEVAYVTATYEAGLPTMTPSRTPRPTATPSEEEMVKALVEGEIGRTRGVVVDDIYPGQVSVEWQIRDNFTNDWIREGALDDAVKVICVLRDAGYAEQRYFLVGMFDMVDATGNSSNDRAMTLVVPPEMHSDINCDNQVMVDLQAAVDVYDAASLQLHRDLQ